MGSLLRFLLGGALGAVLGFFISQWRAKREPATPGIYTEPRIAITTPFGERVVSELEAAATQVESEVTGWVRVSEQEAAASPGAMQESTRLAEQEVMEELVSAPQPVDQELVTEPESGAQTVPWQGWAKTSDAESYDGFATAMVWPPASSAEEPSAPAGAEEAYPSLDSLIDEVGAASAPVGAEADQPHVISAEELRARIEESRRRIRRELEEPFALPLKPPTAAVDRTVFTSDIAQAVAVEPDVWEEAAPALEIQPVDQSVFEELGVRTEGVAFPGSPQSTDLHSRLETAHLASEETLRPTPEELESSLSYDAMRARIEEARDRLKAKVLDVCEEYERVESEDDIRADLDAKIDSLLTEEPDRS
jgi:hypothetical protein